MEACHVPGLSCEPGIHRGGRGLNQRVDRARREEILFKPQPKLSTKRNWRRTQ